MLKVSKHKKVGCLLGAAVCEGEQTGGGWPGPPPADRSDGVQAKYSLLFPRSPALLVSPSVLPSLGGGRSQERSGSQG